MFQDNYLYLLKKLNLNHTKVAEAIGVTSTATLAYGTGAIPRPKTMKKLAAFFNVPIDKLQYGSFDETDVIVEKQGINIPLLTMDNVGSYLDKSLSSFPTFHCTYDVDLDSYAVYMEGDSMVGGDEATSISDGAMLIIEPQAKAESRKIVLAKLKDSGVYTIKRLMTDAGKSYLTPANSSYASIEIDDNVEVVGVAKLAIKEKIL